MPLARSASRLLLSGIFISGGAQAFIEPGGRTKKVAEAGLPESERVVELNGQLWLSVVFCLHPELYQGLQRHYLLGR